MLRCWRASWNRLSRTRASAWTVVHLVSRLLSTRRLRFGKYSSRLGICANSACCV